MIFIFYWSGRQTDFFEFGFYNFCHSWWYIELAKNIIFYFSLFCILNIYRILDLFDINNFWFQQWIIHLLNCLPWLGHTYVTVAKLGLVGHIRSHLIYRVYIRLHRSCKIHQPYHRLHRWHMCKYYSLWWCQCFDSLLSWWQ